MTLFTTAVSLVFVESYLPSAKNATCFSLNYSLGLGAASLARWCASDSFSFFLNCVEKQKLEIVFDERQLKKSVTFFILFTMINSTKVSYTFCCID